MQDDTETVRLVLEALENVSQVSTEDTDGESYIKSILDANNGRSMLQDLQHHDNGKYLSSSNSALLNYLLMLMLIYDYSFLYFETDIVRKRSTSILEIHFSSE